MFPGYVASKEEKMGATISIFPPTPPCKGFIKVLSTRFIEHHEANQIC